MATASNKIIITDNNGARELLGQELADFLTQQAKDKIEADKLKAEAEAKAQAKGALLERLGITADEARLLLA
jgi:hypothetical protein